jgi:hypothetical protein
MVSKEIQAEVRTTTPYGLAQSARLFQQHFIWDVKGNINCSLKGGPYQIMSNGPILLESLPYPTLANLLILASIESNNDTIAATIAVRVT